jgi:hypothetical protein
MTPKSMWLAVLVLLASSVHTQAAEPGTYEASYQASAIGLRTTAYRTQERIAEHSYRLQNSLSITMLGATVGTITETSEFLWQDDTLVPQHYLYEQTGIRSRREEAEFNWETGMVASHDDGELWDLPIEPGAMDRLSFSVRLGRDIADHGLSEFRYQILDGDEFDEHHYRVRGEEILNTPLGALRTVHIERIRDPGSERRTSFWLASDWDYLLVRLEQVNGAGRLTELQLESAIVAGTTVTEFIP